MTPKVQQDDQQFRGHTWMYGYGNMFILDDTDQIVRYGHTGEEDGASCRLYYYPEQNLDVVILSNQSWGAGDLAWESDDPGDQILHGSWSNPAYGEMGGKAQIVFPGGDGWIYSYEPETGELSTRPNPSWKP